MVHFAHPAAPGYLMPPRPPVPRPAPAAPCLLALTLTCGEDALSAGVGRSDSTRL